MSLFPTTDIVFDTARAADPRRVQAAMKRLETAGVALGAPHRDFGQALPPPPTSRETIARRSEIDSRPVQKPLATAESAAQKFEAFLLQSWLEIILPKEESGAFGSGGAGGVWRSLMAEQLGGQLAMAGGVGLQKLLDSSYASPPAPSA